MKIKVKKDLYVELNTLVSIEWKKYYPVLVVHEKFEKILKWITRIITLIGILSSVFTISPWYCSLGIAILIFLFGLFFERAILEYTTMVFQPPPHFEIDYGQWKTNGFMLPLGKNASDLAYFGPSYLNKEYAINFFKYLRTWIDNESNDDVENNLIVSLVIEPDEEYTTYIYANLGRKRLDQMFKVMKDISKMEKYGKRQQQFFSQLFYWNTLDFKEGFYIKKFLEFQKTDKPFIFTPSVIQPFGLPPDFLFDYAIKKYQFKLRKRIDLVKTDPEYLFKPEPKKGTSEPSTIDQKGEPERMYKDIERVLSNSEDVGFSPNEGKKAGVINLCFSDPHLPNIAYKKMIEFAGDQKTQLTINSNDNYLDFRFQNDNFSGDVLLKVSKYNKTMFQEFISVNGGGPAVVITIGYPPADKNQIFMNKDDKLLIVMWQLGQININ
jgi:hypothetical protein